MSAGSGGGGAAVLRLDSTLLRRAAAPSFGSRPTAPRPTIGSLDLVVDLGVRIGSREWFGGLATCLALCIAAYACAPTLGPMVAAAPAPLGDAHWAEARALSIAPLGLGADTGRRMAASDTVVELALAPERPRIDLVAVLGRGDSFSRVLERSGVSPVEAAEIEQMVAAVVSPDEIKPGTNMEVQLGRRPNAQAARPLESLSFRARFDLDLAVKRVDGRLHVVPTPIAVDETPLRIQGRVGSGLYQSARAAGVPAKAVEAFIRAISTQINMTSIAADDRFDLILEHRRAATGDSETGQLLYAGLNRSNGRSLQLMQWQDGDKMQWFEASGVGRESGMLQRPVAGAVSSNFGLRRHPILGYTRMHKGMDFRAGYGTPILAATDGRVSAAGWAGGYGKQVRISHAGGLLTSYSHMSRIVAQPGTLVRQGQLIGYVGSTGLSTGPHLHYELYRNGAPINPMSVRFTTRAQLSGEDLAGFRARLRSLLSLPAGAPRAKEGVRQVSPEVLRSLIRT